MSRPRGGKLNVHMLTETGDSKKNLEVCLKYLALPTMRSIYEHEARRAERETLGYEAYLHRLVEQELDDRKAKRVERLLYESHLPLNKTFENFDLKRVPPKVQLQVKALLDGSFLERAENVLAFGKPGSGKTHLLAAISHELIRRGRRVYYATTNSLVQDLLVAKKALRLNQRLKNLSKYDALFIDDIGYVQQSRDEMEVLFTLFAERYEKGSIMLTSNLPFGEWEKIFKDPMTTVAAIDRLVHHSVIIELNITSYRIEQAKKRKG